MEYEYMVCDVTKDLYGSLIQKIKFNLKFKLKNILN